MAAPDPAADGTSPFAKRPAPFVMTRHHTTGAIGDPRRVENVGNMTAKLHEPRLVGRPVATVGKENRMILIGCQQAFTPCGGPQHQHGELDRRRAAAGLTHFRLRQTRCLAEGGTILAADDSGYVLTRHIFTGQRRGECRQHAKPGGQLAGCFGGCQPVANHKCRRDTLADEFTRRHPADQMPAGSTTAR